MSISFKNQSDFCSVDIRDTFIDSDGRAHFIGCVDEENHKAITLVNLVNGQTYYFTNRSQIMNHLKENGFKKRDFSLTIL
jgi:YHS domain-containing protein